MEKPFFLASLSRIAAGIILILALLAPPTSSVLAARAARLDVQNGALKKPSQIISWEPPLDPEFSKWDNTPVTYDPTNGVAIQPRFPDCKTCPPKETDYYKPNATLLPEWPASPTVKIISTWPSTDTTECSGILVNASALLTSAHCVFTHTATNCDPSESCWAESLQVFVNYDSDQHPDSGYEQILTWTAWTENRDYNYDLAGIKLDTPLGDTFGWLGFGYNNDNQFFTNKSFDYSSYVGKELIPWQGQFTGIMEHQFYSAGSSEYGQAGAGAHSNDYFHIVYSVLSHQHEADQEITTGHTRITPDMYVALHDWINDSIKDLNFSTYLPIFND